MSIKLQLPKLIDMKPRLTVIGVGGAGCNAVNNMIAAGLQGVDFVVANTDAQSLAASSAEYRIQLGANLTEGLGAGSRPEIGEAAAEEAIEEIRSIVTGSHMVFVAAGMGGGTGTGAAAVVARTARELGILTVGIVCKPFQFEGARRMRIAEAGVENLRPHVDTLIVIPNQNLFRIANERTTFAEAFVLADQVLYSGVACIVELVLKEGLINLDFADVKTVMSGMGSAMMGTGEATGERRAILAAEEAIANPLLDDVSLRGAKGLLLSITGGRDLTLYEVDEAASRVREEIDPDANIIVGATFDDNLGDRLRVSIVASGMARANERPRAPQVSVKPNAAPNGRYQAPHGLANGGAAAPYYPGPVPASPQPQNVEMQRRLSEVLSGVQSAEPVAVPPGGGYVHPQAAAPSYQRETWAAPNNVSIEEGFAKIGAACASGQAMGGHSAPPLPPQPYAYQAAFQAQPPIEPPRTARRIPEIEEFPVVAQRDWHAKQDAALGESQRKSGFFSRFGGMGRKQAETNRGATVNREESQEEAETDAQTPIYFGRERR